MNKRMVAPEDSARRNFLTTAVTAGFAVGAAALSLSPALALDRPLTYRDIPSPGYLNLPGLPGGHDIHVLNYALTLEDLEADLYYQAVLRLTDGGVNSVGKTIPGLGLSEYEPDVYYIKAIAPVEAEHRDFLRGSLNGLLDGIAQKPYRYDFGIETKSREEVLALVLLAEKTGTMAYLGALPLLKSKLFITAASAIQGTEARHTAVLTAIQNTLFNGSNPVPVAPLATDNQGREQTMDPDSVLASVSPFIVKA
jgi:plasmid stability protein